MNAFLLIVIIFGMTLQQVARKAYNIRVTGGVYSFSAASALVAALLFVAVSGGSFQFSSKAFLYALAFAIAYSVAMVFTLLAITEGPLALTSLIISYSLIIPTFYGLLFLNEPVGIWLLIGIFLLLLSLFLINWEKKGEKKTITLKWGIFALLAFAGNGACSTIQKVQQIDCSGRYKNEFMMIALTISAVVMFLIALPIEKKQLAGNLKQGFLWYFLCGLGNGAVNLFVLVLSLKMPASVMFPLISAGGIVATVFISLFVYKEKLSIQQKFGVALGTLAIVALNL